MPQLFGERAWMADALTNLSFTVTRTISSAMDDEGAGVCDRVCGRARVHAVVSTFVSA